MSTDETIFDHPQVPRRIDITEPPKSLSDDALAYEIRRMIMDLKKLAEEAAERSIDVEMEFEQFATSNLGTKALSPGDIGEVRIIRREKAL